MVPFQIEGVIEKSRRFTVILSASPGRSTAPSVDRRRANFVGPAVGGGSGARARQSAQLAHHSSPAHERKLKKLKGSREAEPLAKSIAICQDEVKRLDGIITHFLEPSVRSCRIWRDQRRGCAR